MNHLIAALRQPASMARLNLTEWELLLRQALAANLTPALGAIASEHGLLGQVPAPARAHLDWAAVQATRHARAVDWEIRQIRAALANLGEPLILLKGAAYAAARLPLARGRLFSDVDILVPRARLGAAEGALMLHGWASVHQDAYDQRYYREWMHEIPPMVHLRRDTAIDVHHTILPLTARAHPDPDKLRAAAVEVPGMPGVFVLAPVDMVLHSATHLFYDGEFDKGLRDLLDIQRLLQHFGADPAFWDALAPRAFELELARPLFYALRYAARLLDAQVPARVNEAIAAAAPNAALLALMDALFLRALQPLHASCADRWSGLARQALYVRGNWLRMPPLLLARHLFHKAFVSPRAQAV
ncbi:MAG: nucleotidyltransferase family protein [Gammaproteobacteria bacterium]